MSNTFLGISFNFKHEEFKSLIMIAGMIFSLISCNQNKYYISSSGNDQNKGSMRNPWQTIEKLNTVDLEPGDQVFFEGGSTFNGTLRLTEEDKGEQNKKVMITSFGGQPAIINGGTKEGLIATGMHHLLIYNLIFNGDGRLNGNETHGIHIENSDSVEIDKVEVHGFQHSGLHVHKSKRLNITNVYAHDNGFAGIHVNGTTMNDNMNYDNENVYIGYCIAENNPGDPTVLKGHSGNGILVSSVRKGVIEYCKAFNNGWDMPWDGNGPVGIWIWDASDFIIQYCIAHDNKTHPGARDGGGFDFDGGVSNSTLQYNVSYNNVGPGIGLFEFGAAKEWHNNVVRYNLSYNDGKNGEGPLGIWKNKEKGNMRDCIIYNNTFYNSDGPAITILTNLPGFEFYNNIFVFSGNFLFNNQRIKDEKFLGNLYWNLERKFRLEKYESFEDWTSSTRQEMASDSVVGLYTDPMFQDPGEIMITDPADISLKTLSGYSLKAESPAINKGLNLKEHFEIDPGNRDLLGSPIPNEHQFDLGAIEFQTIE